MPKITELKEIEGNLWARLQMDKEDGPVTLLSDAEIKAHGHACVRDFLIDLFNQWKDRQ